MAACAGVGCLAAAAWKSTWTGFAYCDAHHTPETDLPLEYPAQLGTVPAPVAQSAAVAQDVSEQAAEAICREEVSLGGGRGIAAEYVAPLLAALDASRASKAAAVRRAEVAEARLKRAVSRAEVEGWHEPDCMAHVAPPHSPCDCWVSSSALGATVDGEVAGG